MFADDVDLIPAGIVDVAPAPTPAPAAPPKASSLQQKLFLEDALAIWSKARPVHIPYPLTENWQNRSSFDAILHWKPIPKLQFTLSDRVNVFEDDGAKFWSKNTLRNDLREASITWEPAPSTFLEAGRINVRNGAALGYNPTDFFKTRTLVGQASLDPSVLRQNRLGTLMARAETIWTGGSATVAYAPKVTSPAPLIDRDPLGVDPHFDATNGANRVLCTLSENLFDLSPQILGYFEPHHSKLGANVTRSVGDSIVAYAEWAGALEPKFKSDVATGFSWTVATTITLNAEYHFHDAGFDRADWRRWFDHGNWLVRANASDQQEPITQHQLFLRASYPRAFVPELELTAFAFVDLLDGSVLSQAAASYYVTDHWTASAFVSANLGSERTERGSFPQRGNLILQVTRYL